MFDSVKKSVKGRVPAGWRGPGAFGTEWVGIGLELELIKSNRDSVRKAREAYLIDRGQTLEPLGLNRRDET